MTVRTGLGAWARSCALAQAGRAADRCSLLLHQAADAAQRAADRALERPGPASDPVDRHHAEAMDAITGIHGWLVHSERVDRVEDAIADLDGRAVRLIRDAETRTRLVPLGEDDTHFELWEFACMRWSDARERMRMQLHPAGQQDLARHVGAMKDRMTAHGLQIVRRNR